MLTNSDQSKISHTDIPFKPRKRIKISVPSLAEFADEDVETTRKEFEGSKPNLSTDLFSILPPPKRTLVSTKSFVPNVVAKKKHQIKPSANKSQTLILNNKTDLENLNVFTQLSSQSVDDEIWQKVCGKKLKTLPSQTSLNRKLPESNISNKSNNMLSNHAFRELFANCKGSVNTKLIDINEEPFIPDKCIWMRKSLTDPAYAPKYEITDPVNNTCKKKHHITYLVQQTKANEEDLKNQWALNKYSRKQTQAKYGF